MTARENVRFVWFGAVTLSVLLTCTQGAVPVFVTPAPDGSSSVSIDEGSSAGVSIYTVSAIDVDGGTLSYTIISPGTKFQILSNSLTLTSTIDFETEGPLYTIILQATTTSNTTVSTSNASMAIRITDINDEVPVIVGTFTGAVDEEQPVGTIVPGLYTASDADAGDVLSYSLIGTSHFQIDSGSGVIAISQVIDYDSGSTSFTFTLVVKDSATPAHTATQSLTVTVVDINDNTPVFTPAVYYVSIPENTNPGVSVARVSVTDKDAADTVTVSIQGGDDAVSKFVVNIDVIETYTTAIDYDLLGGQNYMYTLEIVGVDNGPGSNTGTSTVFVTVTGLNDNAPVWSAFSPAYNAAVPYSFSENVPAGTIIVTIAASDTDAGIDGELAYTIGTISASGSGSTNGLFHMDVTSGVLTISSNILDRDPATGGSDIYNIAIHATDKGTIPQSVTRTITIRVTDINDNAPMCTASQFTATVSENVGIGYSVLTISAIDADATAANNVINYTVTGGSGMQSFEAEATTGVVKTSNTIDYEVMTSYDIEITVTDSGTPTFTSTCLARINITDMNDNTPTFPATSIAISVPENEPIGYSVTTAQSADLDSSVNNNNVVVYSFSAVSGEFRIDANTGWISTSAVLDRETVSSYTLIVHGTDQGVPQNTGSLTYTVSVTDTNDNPPIITGTYATSIDEDTPLNTFVFAITATDMDDGTNSALMYAITNGDTTSRFFIDNGSGLVQVRQSLDREVTALYYLEITVTDYGTPAFSASVTASVTVGDINDNNPRFSKSQHTFAVSEAVVPGTIVGTVVATDADSGINAIMKYTFAYFITGDSTHFNIDDVSGVILTAANLDRETANMYVMVIRATDGGIRPLTGTSTVTITVTDNNDNIPVFSSGSYACVTTENQAIGTSLLAVTVTDNDIGLNSDISLSIDTSTPAGIRANSYIAADSATFILYVKRMIDRELDSSFVFDLIATDRGTPALSTKSSINISVVDVNDNNPVFTPPFYSTEIAYNDACQTTVVTITSTDADTGMNADVTYTTSQNNYSNMFMLNENTGDVTIVGPAVTDTMYLLYASASDSGSPSLSTWSDAVIRIDTYHPNDVILNYHMDINCSTYLARESTFLRQLTAVYQMTYVAPSAKRWCTVEANITTCVVRVYVVKDDTADELSELANTKNILTVDEAYLITSNGSNGSPSPHITGALWTMFRITKVERYYTVPTSVPTSTPWIESTTGIIVLSLIGAVVFIAVTAGVALAYYYKYRKQKQGSFTRKSRVGAVDGNKMIHYNNMGNKNIDKKTSMPRVSVDEGGTGIHQNGKTRQLGQDNPRNLVKNRQFDGRAVDPATGRVYGYNIGSGDRSWTKTPDGEPNLQF